MKEYRGRLAPTPSGYLHAGHAYTFNRAWHRARDRGGQLVYRNEDLDPSQCHEAYHHAAMEDLRWLGIDWDEGPDLGGAYEPYQQSQTTELYRQAWQILYDKGTLYPCKRSKREIKQHANPCRPRYDLPAEPIYPPQWRPPIDQDWAISEEVEGDFCWRFRIPDGRSVFFEDQNLGIMRFTAGVDFGDFVVWRKGSIPSYELAVVVDDHRMRMTEVVRGRDLLRSTARQLLIYEALEYSAPEFYHTLLITDENGSKLSKREKPLSIRHHRGAYPDPHSYMKACEDQLEPPLVHGENK